MGGFNRTVFSRRRLLKGATALAAVTIVPRVALGGPSGQALSEKPALAGVGVGGADYGQLQACEKAGFQVVAFWAGSLTAFVLLGNIAIRTGERLQ
jgi:hypothetical protein